MTETLKQYTFQPTHVIFEQLKAAAITPESDFLRVLRKFAETIGGQRKVSYGVNIAFALAIHDVATLPGAVPFIGAMLDLEFNDLMTAIIDDAEFLTDVIRVHDEVMGG